MASWPQELAQVVFKAIDFDKAARAHHDRLAKEKAEAEKAADHRAAGGGGPQKWSKAEIKAELRKTARGMEILTNMPPGIDFKAFERKPGDERGGYFNRAERTIYIPSSFSSKEAAPAADHEAVHADQTLNQLRPRDELDRLEMEVEAKNAGLDVWEQMGRPERSYEQGEADWRKRDPKGYEDAVREHYKKHYGIK
jgi:hypothetical protein